MRCMILTLVGKLRFRVFSILKLIKTVIVRATSTATIHVCLYSTFDICLDEHFIFYLLFYNTGQESLMRVQYQNANGSYSYHIVNHNIFYNMYLHCMLD